MKNILIFCTVLLTGCSTVVPVKYTFPTVPEVLLEKCEALDTIEKPTSVLSELMKTVTNNYRKYYSCGALVESWQEWYTAQKKIAETTNSE